MKKQYKHSAIILLLLCLLSASVGAGLGLWSQNKELTEEQVSGMTAPNYSQASFISSDGTETDHQSFLNEKRNLVNSNKNFVVVNLEQMQLTLYQQGQVKQTYPVLSKGEEGSWWETPTGAYSVLSKESNHYSSIGNVWMPWSIQFYGNFYLHGWPYYPGGAPVEEGFSGGCIRLSENNAKKVYNFVDQETPILVNETEETGSQTRLTLEEEVPPPDLTAGAVLVADVKTGQILLDKNMDSVKSIASLTKLMTAVVASEVVYIGEEVRISKAMREDSYQGLLEEGRYYKIFNLLYPLLRQSSNPAGEAIVASLGKDEFVEQMNEKAESLGMSKTSFADPTGLSEKNTSTLRDLFKLSVYMLEKRKFLYDISVGKNHYVFNSTPFAGLKTANGTSSNTHLVGAKIGYTSVARDTYASVWKFEQDGETRYIFMGFLGSGDRDQDGKKLIDWAEDTLRVTLYEQ